MKRSYAFIRKHRGEHSIQRLCETLGVSPSGYHRWVQKPECSRVREDRHLSEKIRTIHAEHRSVYGSPRVHRELRRQGERVSRKRVARLMREQGLRGRPTPRKYKPTTQSDHVWPIAPNLLMRRFEAERPNQVWTGDVTMLRTGEGWLYLAVLLDLYSRWVVGWSIQERQGAPLVLAALEMAVLHRRPEPGLLHHTDRGLVYSLPTYRHRLDELGFEVSMSRKANCYDNAVTESFFGSFKVEAGDFFATRALARLQTFSYIEAFYNRRRLHSTLDYLSPVEFEARTHSEVRGVEGVLLMN